MQRDLMRTYAAGYWKTLLKLRLPAAMPFIFNGLKIATTLALIGAIVAEFFGSPVRAWGSVFRPRWDSWRWIWSGPRSSSPRLSARPFMEGLHCLEKTMTFWHPSQRR